MAEKQAVSQKTLEVFDYTPAYKNRVCLHEVAVYLRLIHATLVPYSFSFFTPFIALSLYYHCYVEMYTFIMMLLTQGIK